MLRHCDVRCGDCEHYDEEGCEQAAEALVLDGWPRLSACPDESADASRCPEFLASAASGLALDEEASAARAHARVSTIKGYQSW
ncbi:MAG: hypothetical protein KKA55_07760 [Proteobacteria bacterium]|nr:hypothetical protein [Pseudomonadota bacterium]MBU1595415.1 hypothetical protein [Pseudomonadota bacterium]